MNVGISLSPLCPKASIPPFTPGHRAFPHLSLYLLPHPSLVTTLLLLLLQGQGDKGSVTDKRSDILGMVVVGRAPAQRARLLLRTVNGLVTLLSFQTVEMINFPPITFPDPPPPEPCVG